MVGPSGHNQMLGVIKTLLYSQIITTQFLHQSSSGVEIMLYTETYFFTWYPWSGWKAIDGEEKKEEEEEKIMCAECTLPGPLVLFVKGLIYICIQTQNLINEAKVARKYIISSCSSGNGRTDSHYHKYLLFIHAYANRVGKTYFFLLKMAGSICFRQLFHF